MKNKKLPGKFGTLSVSRLGKKKHTTNKKKKKKKKKKKLKIKNLYTAPHSEYAPILVPIPRGQNNTATSSSHF
jgi:hypothetical protein